jgi:hypothetical protein
MSKYMFNILSKLTYLIVKLDCLFIHKRLLLNCIGYVAANGRAI